MLILLAVFSTTTKWASCSSDNVLWGVPPSEVHLYKPGQKFTCKDQKQTVSYDKVNDNYCDCADGSDEPSTSACAHGVFYCLNKGYLGHMVPSNRVNDGVCDCCDGSDEYSSQICPNTCAELELEKIKREQEKDEEEDGDDPEDFHDDDDDDNESVYRASMVHMGTRKQQERLERLRKLELEKALTEEALKELEKLTKSAEMMANDALDKLKNDPHDGDENSIENGYAHDAFEHLDLNKDGILSLEEIKKEEIFDLDKNMIVEDKEVKWYYDAMPGIANEELFRKKMWSKMGRLFVLEKKLDEAIKFEFNFQKLEEEPHEEESAKREKKSVTEEPEKDDDTVDLDEDEMEDLEDELENLDVKTRGMVQEALNARKKLNDMKEKLEKVKKQKEQAEQTLFEGDPDDEDRHEGIVEHLDNFGPRERSKYFPMRLHCFKYNDKNFLYRMCPFFGCTQTLKDKSNKDMIDLGRWVGWGKENGEPIMVFKNGEYCEPTGGRRSTRVRIYCGSRNLLVHVEETETCKYRMEFKSPAGCHLRNLKDANFTYTSHDEL